MAEDCNSMGVGLPVKNLGDSVLMAKGSKAAEGAGHRDKVSVGKDVENTLFQTDSAIKYAILV